MKTLIFTNSQFSPSLFLLSFSLQNAKVLHSSSPESPCILRPAKPVSLSKPSATNNSNNSLTCGGWDDFLLGGELVNTGESNQLPDFLVSRGIDDNKKYIFVFMLGLFCAFAISRVRVSSIIIFPASALIFGIGFSLGFFRGGSFNEFSSNASKKKGKDEIFRVYSEKLRSLVRFFYGFDVKVNDLKTNIQRAINTKEIGLDDLENYVGIIESMQASALNSRNIVEGAIESVGNSNSVLVEDQKSSLSKRKKEIGEAGLGLLQFVGGLFGEKMVDSKPLKGKDKDNLKQGAVPGLNNDQIQGNSKGLANDQTQVNSSTQHIKLKGIGNESALDWDGESRIRIISENERMGEMGGNEKRFVDGQEYSYQSSRLQFVDNQCVSWKKNQNNETKMWRSHENMQKSMDFNFSFKHIEREASFAQGQMLKQSSGSKSRKVNEDETYRSQFREEGLSDDSHLPDYQFGMEDELGSSSSSMLADDVVFDRYLSEANNLLKQAKAYIRGKHDEEPAEIILYKSAKLLSKALAMKPMSLLAVGLLGNTYLLHGELKLKISRELRTLLSRRDPLSVESRGNVLKGLDTRVSNKDKIASALVNVCEECEELLVEAGRKYRLALSIDGNDVRALYNWGLALSFRAQLIADIGPEAAFDADKVFLAAIDKFDAMMSKGNVYAPDALYRWGVVLQQRSRLRPRNSKEKVKLLMQAKRLYEDALNMDCDHLKVREAISSCIAELNHRHL